MMLFFNEWTIGFDVNCRNEEGLPRNSDDDELCFQRLSSKGKGTKEWTTSWWTTIFNGVTVRSIAQRGVYFEEGRI